MTMTVKVYKDVTRLTGLYKWDYEIHNDSIASQFGDDAVNGVASVGMQLSSNIPDLANVSPPSNWNYYSARGGDGGLVFFVNSNTGTDPNPLRLGFRNQFMQYSRGRRPISASQLFRARSMCSTHARLKDRQARLFSPIVPGHKRRPWVFPECPRKALL